MVETNTFGSTPLVLAEYGLAEKAFEISRRAAELAREVAARFSTRERLRFVAGSMGPTTKAITVTGGVSFDELTSHFRTQAAGLLAGGADVLLLETTQDTRNLKAGLIGVQEAFGEIGWSVPIMVSVTIEPMGTMLAGQAIDALYASIQHVPLLSVGLNCATGPEFMTDHIRTLSGLAKTLVSGVEILEVDVDNRPVLVGERTNVLGSRKFKRLVAEGNFEAAAEIARAKVKGGAQIIDVCLQDPDREETADAEAFLGRATR